jgi:CRP-like cAMP-binding protein
MSDYEWEQILVFFEKKFFAENEIIFNEGDSADFAAFILSGSVIIKKRTEFSDKYFVLSILDKGSFIGENFLVTYGEAKRNVSIIAKESTELALIDRKGWAKLLHDKPDLANKMLIFLLYAISCRLSSMNERLEAMF